MEKVCTKCSIKKRVYEFYPAEDGRFGVSAMCKECSRAYTRNWYRNRFNRPVNTTPNIIFRNDEMELFIRRKNKFKLGMG